MRSGKHPLQFASFTLASLIKPGETQCSARSSSAYNSNTAKMSTGPVEDSKILYFLFAETCIRCLCHSGME